ncbi:Por secretion system C-terminal sorting domain-containing protein, partial [Lishizhenia tianjinensis]
ITEPTVLSASGSVNANVSCNAGNDGEATVNVTGGTSPYTYAWSNTATTQTITGVAAGTYTVTVTDANGCTTTASATVTEPTLLSASGSVNANVSCNAGGDGEATVNVTGGTAPYTYAWSNSATTQTITGVTAGTYTVTVTDANGCTENASVTITEPTVLSTTGSVNANVSCNAGSDGEATVNVTGGTAPYTYAWSNSATTQTITGVTAGTYTVTVTDANGCTENASVTITEPNVLSATGSVNANVSCNAGNDGEATVNVTGGTAPYTYAWSNTATTQTISGVAAGTYTVTVTDANGCTENASVTITEPTVLSATGSVNANVSCNAGSDGEATINVTGGTAPYTYAWSNSATTQTITGVTAGTYTVTVTDANGCTATASATVTEPTVLSATGSVNANVSCNAGSDGEATVNVTGGTAPYTYAWSNTATTQAITGVTAGTYTVTVTDANGCTENASVTITEPTVLSATASVNAHVTCNAGSNGEATVSVTGGTAPYTYNWSNAAMTPTITGVTAGTYTVTVTDANGCTENASVTITEPTALLASTVVDATVSCNGLSDGAATVNASGGTAPYTYLWDNSETTTSISGLTAGTYNVVVTDANGCTVNASVMISEPAVLATTNTIQNVSCYGAMNGMVDVVPTGGTGPYAYSWSNQATTPTITGLEVGNYNVQITDANGCIITQNATITQPAILGASATAVADVTCPSSIDGSATVNPTGGTQPYTYLWDNGETSQTATALSSGVHTVSVIDANGCNQSTYVTIGTGNALDNASFAYGNSIYCKDAVNPVPTISGVNGGTFSATTGLQIDAATGEIDVLNSISGVYTVTYTTNGTCSNSSNVQVTIQDLDNASFNFDQTEYCQDYQNPTPTITGALGGTFTASSPNLVINAATGEIDIANSVAGNYSVTYTTNGYCSNSSAEFVTINTVNVATSVDQITITADAIGATYQWLDCDNNMQVIVGETSSSYTATANGNYAVIVTENGCSDTSDCVVISTVGLEKMDLANAFTVYPNPTQGTFNVQFDRVQEHIDFRIFNLAGELIQVAEMNFSNQMTMNIDLPKGVYLLEVTDKHDQKAVVKIIKQ